MKFILLLCSLFMCAFELKAYESTEKLTLQVVSSRKGLLFTDSEPIDVRVCVRQANGSVSVRYKIQETEGSWSDSGKVQISKIENGTGEMELPLKLPGRGLYHLKLHATSKKIQVKTETWIAVVFTPKDPDPESPWGIFYLPHICYDLDRSIGSNDVALSHRLLGASWVRLNFYAEAFEDLKINSDEQKVAVQFSTYKSYVESLRVQDLSILGEICALPSRELSSIPEDTTLIGIESEASPAWSMTKPGNYQLWGHLIEKLAREFRKEIRVWEIWNEPNIEDSYWKGTADDFAGFVRHTSQALRRGNPKARVAGSGFHDVAGTGNRNRAAFVERLFELGMGQDLDILTTHYSDENPQEFSAWQKLRAQYNLTLPLWNTEEIAEIPLNNMAAGIERSFKFLHLHLPVYKSDRYLVRDDLTVLPSGIFFSVGAHCLGISKFIDAHDKIPGYRTYFFQREDEKIAVLQRRKGTKASSIKVNVKIKPLHRSVLPTATDKWGRSTPISLTDGRGALFLKEDLLFINGCQSLEIDRE